MNKHAQKLRDSSWQQLEELLRSICSLYYEEAIEYNEVQDGPRELEIHIS